MLASLHIPVGNSNLKSFQTFLIKKYTSISGHTASPMTQHSRTPTLDGVDADAASIASNISSTRAYEREPLTTYQYKVIDLCKMIWPHLSSEAFKVTHMKGGSYNRVVNLKVDLSQIKLSWYERQAKQFLQLLHVNDRYKNKGKGKAREYVVRVPRFEHAWFEQEVALLVYLSAKYYQAPKLKSFSLSTDNPLCSRFTIQPRLSGKSVNEVYLCLNTAQRISFALDFGIALKAMTKHSFPCPGTLDPAGILSVSPDVQMLRLQCPPRNARRPASGEVTTISSPMSVYDFIKMQLNRQREYDILVNHQDLNPWKQFAPIIDELYAKGLFHDNQYYLTHMDLEPRNILVHTISSTTAQLSAILDWDEAIFAPAFLNCRPPSWLWDFEGDDDEELDESVAHVDPTNEDLLDIKKVFEAAVGTEYCKYAYSPEYRLARDITRLAVVGIGCDKDYETAERILREWIGMYPDKEVGGMEEYDD